MNARNTIIAYLLVLLAGLIAATQWVGYRLDYHPDLGGFRIAGQVIYPPWAIFAWARDFGANIPRTLNEGYAIIGKHSFWPRLCWLQAADCAAASRCARSARTGGPANPT